MVRSATAVSPRNSAHQPGGSGLSHEAFADLFDGLREGIYIGLVGPDDTATLAANPHLRSLFGWSEQSSDADVRPFGADRKSGEKGNTASTSGCYYIFASNT